jgi:DNA-binding response OmpR family regulator
MTSPPTQPSSHPIVLIDDDRLWREAVGALLRDEGFAIEAAEDGTHGLELLERSDPLLVILDAHLPKLGGMEVLRELRRRGRSVPILMVSSDDQAGLYAQALAEGASGFLHKPISGDVLLRAIRRLAHRPGRDGAPPPP